jgi:hypothetical protein
LNIRWREVLNLTDSHASPDHQFQHNPIPDVCGSKDALINSLLIHDVPLNSLRTLENLFDYGSVAGIGEGRQTRIDTEIIERASTEYRFLFVACLLLLVKESRNSSTSSWDMLAKSRFPNWAVKRERTNSQVLMVFFLELAR